MERITSPHLADFGSDVHEVWTAVAPRGGFKGVSTKALIDGATGPAQPAGAVDWAQWIALRYPI